MSRNGWSGPTFCLSNGLLVKMWQEADVVLHIPSSDQVRFSALLMLLELAAKLRENYMVLLPETIPFLAELMEDECEEVEHQVQKVIREMEVVLGEPLQNYF